VSGGEANVAGGLGWLCPLRLLGRFWGCGERCCCFAGGGVSGLGGKGRGMVCVLFPPVVFYIFRPKSMTAYAFPPPPFQFRSLPPKPSLAVADRTLGSPPRFFVPPLFVSLPPTPPPVSPLQSFDDADDHFFPTGHSSPPRRVHLHLRVTGIFFVQQPRCCLTSCHWRPNRRSV